MCVEDGDNRQFTAVDPVRRQRPRGLLGQPQGRVLEQMTGAGGEDLGRYVVSQDRDVKLIVSHADDPLG
jgi:hypothetical protein